MSHVGSSDYLCIETVADLTLANSLLASIAWSSVRLQRGNTLSNDEAFIEHLLPDPILSSGYNPSGVGVTSTICALNSYPSSVYPRPRPSRPQTDLCSLGTRLRPKVAGNSHE